MKYSIKQYIIEEGILQHVKDNVGKYALGGLAAAAAGSGEFGDDIKNFAGSAGESLSNAGSHILSSAQHMTNHYDPGHSNTIPADEPKVSNDSKVSNESTDDVDPTNVFKNDPESNPESKPEGFFSNAGAGAVGAGAGTLGLGALGVAALRKSRKKPQFGPAK